MNAHGDVGEADVRAAHGGGGWGVGASSRQGWGVRATSGAVTLVAAVVFLLYYQAQPHWLADPDAQDYAQLGRQVVQGRGMTTRFLPWNGLDYLTQRGEVGPDWPSIARFPLTPLLMASSFAVFGASDDAVHLPAGLAFILTAGCVSWLATRVYGTVAGIVAGLTAALLPVLVNYSLTGLTEPLLGLLLVAILACVASGSADAGAMHRAPTMSNAAVGVQFLTPRGSAVLLAGLLLGLAVLNRYDTLLLAVPIALLWLLRRPDRWRAIATFVLPAAILVLPWSAYLTIQTGSPLFNLQPASIAAQASGRADGLGWYLPEYVAPTEVWTRNPERAVRIAWEEVAGTPNHLRKLLGWPWLAAGAAACLLALGRAVLAPRSARVPHAAALVLFLTVAVLLRAALASVLGLNLQRHFVPLVPLLLVVVAGEAVWLVGAIVRRLTGAGSYGRVATMSAQAMVGLALVVPGLWTIGPFLLPPSHPPGPPPRNGEIESVPANLGRLADLVGPDAIVASNVPWSVAWQADRRAVPLPPTVEVTPDLEARFQLRIDAIYLAASVNIADAPRSWRGWEDLRRRGTPPPGYVLAESFPNGSRLFVKAP